MTPEQEQRRQRARQLHGEGMTLAEIARTIGVSWGTAKNYTQDLGLPDNATSRSSRSKALQNEQNNQLAHAMLMERAFDLILSGMPMRQVARQVGRSYPVIRNWVTDEIEKRIAPKVEQLRVMESARYDHMRSRAWEIMEDRDNPVGHRLAAMDRLLHISRGYRALMGLDSPIRVEATVTEQTEADREMAELMNELRARNAVIEGQIVDGQS